MTIKTLIERLSTYDHNDGEATTVVTARGEKSAIAMVRKQHSPYDAKLISIELVS